MNPRLRGMVTAAAIMAAAGAGLWIGQMGLIRLPIGTMASMDLAVQRKASGPVVYYRDPTGKPLYSLTPRTTGDGKPYVAVHAGEDVSFDMAEAKPEPPAAGRKVKFYRNPMGLPDTSPSPKKDSMGMDYIPVYEGDNGDEGAVRVSPGKIQRTGVETVTVGRHAVTRSIRAPGAVQLDERRIAVVAPRFDGYVVKVGTATSGTHVARGEPLATIFGQELLNQGARLVIEQGPAWPGDEAFRSHGLKGQAVGVIGAQRRLENLGAPEEFISEIKRTRRVPDTVQFRASMDSIVLERNIVDGQAFKAGDVLFRFADHSVMWVMAEVPEGDIDALRPGQTVSVAARARPGRTFKGTVAVIYPHLMKETRTARVRIELPNPDLALLPGMYTDVEIASGSSENVISVPASAVIDSGSRQVVLLQQAEGRYEPRDVKLGRKGDGLVEILSGVAEGDKVVVNGNFLIDAESNLQAALKGFTAPADTEARR